MHDWELTFPWLGILHCYWKKREKEIGEKYGWRRLKGRRARGGARGEKEGREERVYSS